MPGVDLNLDLPTVSDTLGVIIEKTAIALAAIEADLADRVTSTELTINADLDFSGNSILHAGSLTLTAGDTPEDEGSLYYSAGDFHVITEAGTVRITNGTALNFSASNGFTGDYGDGTETAAYSDSAGEFRFTEDTGVFADLVMDGVVLMGSNGSVRLSTPASVSSALSFIFSALPSSGVSALLYEAGVGTQDNAATRATVARVTNVNLSGSLRHGEVTVCNRLNRSIDMAQNYVVQSSGVGTPSVSLNTTAGTQALSATTTSPFTARIHVPLTMPRGARLLAVTLLTTSGETWTTSNLQVYVVKTYPVGTPNFHSGTIVNSTGGAGASGTGKHVLTLSSPPTVGADERAWVRLTFPEGTGSVYWVLHHYDKVS